MGRNSGASLRLAVVSPTVWVGGSALVNARTKPVRPWPQPIARTQTATATSSSRPTRPTAEGRKGPTGRNEAKSFSHRPKPARLSVLAVDPNHQLGHGFVKLRRVEFRVLLNRLSFRPPPTDFQRAKGAARSKLSSPFLKQTPGLPGITRERMNTILLNQSMNVTFKQVQLLPVLTPAMIVGERAARTLRATPAPVATGLETRAASSSVSDRQLPRSRPDRATGEQALFAVLGLSALICVGQALATMAAWSPNLPKFTAWVTQLIG